MWHERGVGNDMRIMRQPSSMELSIGRANAIGAMPRNRKALILPICKVGKVGKSFAMGCCSWSVVCLSGLERSTGVA